MVACDWQDRGLENLDMVGTSCNPTFNYSDFFQAFHVRPTTDLHGKSAIVVKDIIDEALDEIEKNSINELEQKYFLDNTGKVIRWGSIPNAIQWLRDVRDYCEQNPGYKFIGRGVEMTEHGLASLGTVRTFAPEYAEPSDRQWRKLLEESAELAAVGMDWVATALPTSGFTVGWSKSIATWWKRWERSLSPMASPMRISAGVWASARNASVTVEPVGGKPWRRIKSSTDWRNCPPDWKRFRSDSGFLRLAGGCRPSEYGRFYYQFSHYR